MDESQAASQQIIQYLPIMFGFFALNVPSGLGIYWVTNTLFSTAATVLIRKQVETEMEAAGLSVAPAAVASPGPSTSSSPTSFSDMIEGPPSISADSTFTPLDAEVVDSGLVDDLSVQGFGSAADGGGTPASSKPKKAKKSKRKAKKAAKYAKMVADRWTYVNQFQDEADLVYEMFTPTVQKSSLKASSLSWYPWMV